MTTNNDVKYRHIISLGYFCSVASEIERFGFRDKSYPFDWVLSKSFDKVIELISNNFKNLVKEEELYQQEESRRSYKNLYYDFQFVHDFSEGKSFDSQIKFVQEKYDHRIVRFYQAIQSPTLFIRYIVDENELNFVVNNTQGLENFLSLIIQIIILFILQTMMLNHLIPNQLIFIM